MQRKDVYELIDGEREHQDLTNTEEHDIEHSVSDWVLFMRYQLQKAELALYYLNPELALERIRKATALGVVCMEHNETPPRT